jgi:hypothetical protein
MKVNLFGIFDGSHVREKTHADSIKIIRVTHDLLKNSSAVVDETKALFQEGDILLYLFYNKVDFRVNNLSREVYDRPVYNRIEIKQHSSNLKISSPAIESEINAYYVVLTQVTSAFITSMDSDLQGIRMNACDGDFLLVFLDRNNLYCGGYNLNSNFGYFAIEPAKKSLRRSMKNLSVFF